MAVLMAFTWRVALLSFGSALMAAVGAVAVLGAVLEGLLPTRYRLTPRHVSSRCGWQVRTLPWADVRTLTAGPDGIHLSPLPKASPLWKLRGVTLRYDGNGEQVLDEVRRRTAAAAESKA